MKKKGIQEERPDFGKKRQPHKLPSSSEVFVLPEAAAVNQRREAAAIWAEKVSRCLRANTFIWLDSFRSWSLFCSHPPPAIFLNIGNWLMKLSDSHRDLASYLTINSPQKATVPPSGCQTPTVWSDTNTANYRNVSSCRGDRAFVAGSDLSWTQLSVHSYSTMRHIYRGGFHRILEFGFYWAVKLKMNNINAVNFNEIW